MKRAIDIDRRRVLVAGSVATAAAAIGTVSPRSAAQALRESTRSLPGYASWKDETDVIVHSSNTIETRRDAFGTSGVTDEDILFVRNNSRPIHPSERTRMAGKSNSKAWCGRAR